MIGIVLEERVVWLEEHVGAIFILRRLSDIADQLATLEDSLAHLPFAIAAHLETAAQSIDGLHTHTVQTDRLLEGLGVELTTGVQDAHRVDQLSLGDATAIVTNRHTEVVLDGHLDAVACLHLKLVDRVVEHFLQQHVDTVIGLRTVVELTNIHTRTQTDMLQARQGNDVGIIILHLTTLLINDIVFSFHKSFDILCKGTTKK